MIPTPDWIGRAVDPVARVGRAVARRWHCDPDDGAGNALLALCLIARADYVSEDHFQGTAIVAARRAVSRACRKERAREGKRVPAVLDAVAAPDDATAELVDTLRAAECVIDGMGLAGVIWRSVVIEGRSVNDTATRYSLSVRGVSRSVASVTDALRGVALPPAR